MTKSMIDNYFNNAGAGLMSPSTFACVVRHLELEQSIGPMGAAQQVRPEYDAFYARAAELINARGAHEIAFMDSASRAWNMIVNSISLAPGDRIVTLSSEFGTNLVSLFHRAQSTGASVVVIPCAEDGSFDREALADEVRGAKLVAISHAVAHGSIVNPVEEVGQLAANAGAFYLVDGCQALGQIEADVQSIRCDAYTATGRKWLRGPRGTGFLYVREHAEIATCTVDLASADLDFQGGGRAVSGVQVRADARQFELWERGIAAMLGLSSAIAELLSVQHSDTFRAIEEYGNSIRRAVVDNSNLRLMGKATSSVGNVGFYAVDPALESLIDESLRSAEIIYSTMADWDCPLHFPETGQSKIFRVTPHYYSSESAVANVCRLIRSL